MSQPEHKCLLPRCVHQKTKGQEYTFQRQSPRSPLQSSHSAGVTWQYCACSCTEIRNPHQLSLCCHSGKGVAMTAHTTAELLRAAPPVLPPEKRGGDMLPAKPPTCSPAGLAVLCPQRRTRMLQHFPTATLLTLRVRS